jgi:DNA modification methylase
MLEARPIVVNPELMVLGGNMRLKAAQAAKLPTVPVYVANWDEVQQRRFIIKDNASFGEWDWDMLANEYEPDELAAMGLDLPTYEEQPDEVQEDHFEPPAEVTTDIQPGDRFQIGPHRLICADCTDPKTWETLLEQQWADAVITDPPYNIDYTGKTKEALKIDNDRMSEQAFEDFLVRALKAMNEKTKRGGAWYIWHADTMGLTFRKAMEAAGITLRQNLIWAKSVFTLGRQDYQWKHEPCLYGWKPGAAHYFTPDRTLHTVFEDEPIEVSKLNKEQLRTILTKMLAAETTVLHADKPSASREHPTMKPLTLMGQLIQNSTRPEEIVIDGFLGSGSTMVAAHQLNRKCYGAEIDPKYCQVIIDRMLAFDPSLTVTKQEPA